MVVMEMVARVIVAMTFGHGQEYIVALDETNRDSLFQLADFKTKVDLLAQAKGNEDGASNSS